MGFHICEYCTADTSANVHSHLSSGDVTLVFASGHAWVMPDMILHYIEDHNWVPPQEFIQDVLNETLVAGQRLQTKSPVSPQMVGYLSGKVEFGGQMPLEFGFASFAAKLQSLMQRAAAAGDRIQYRGE